MRYSVHNIVRFEIKDKRKYFTKKIDSLYNQFRYYKDLSDSENLDFIINISEFSPKNEGCQILDGKYYIKNNYIYCRDKKKLSKWEVEINYLDRSPTIINISTNFFGNISLLTNIIDFLIHLKMSEKGYPLIHSSGILMNNKTIAFAARSGGGKTTIVTYLMEKGFKYFGDNFIIINNSQIYNFLSPLNVYTYNLTPLIKRNLNFKKKASIYTKYILYLISRKYIKLSTKLNLFEILPQQIADHGKLDTLFLVIPKKDFAINKITKEKLIKRLVHNQQIEFMHMPFLNYLYAYSYVFPHSKIGSHWKIYENSLYNAISDDIEIREIEVPLRYSSSIIDKIYTYANNS